MKDTGIVRRIDDMGRLVIPKEMRAKLNIQNGDEIEFFVEGDRVILKKYQPSCLFCASTYSLLEYKDKFICPACLNDIKQTF